MKESLPDPQGAILGGWCIILLLALPIGALQAWEVGGKLAATSWPRASAHIVTSSLYRSSKPALWCPMLRVRYQVGGKWHESRQVSSSIFAGAGCDRDKRVLDARLERMRPGDRITVRYDPDDPSDAVVYLAPVLTFFDGLLGAIALVWLGAGMSVIRKGKRQRREQDAARGSTAQPALG